MTLVRTGVQCSNASSSSSSPSDSGGSASEHYRGRYDYSTNLFPEVGGIGDLKEDGGRPTPGDWYVGSDNVTGTLKDFDESALPLAGRITLTYIGDEDGDMQLGANWKINQG